MKNLRLVLTLILILVSIGIVQAQEGEVEGILQMILRFLLEDLNLPRWICQIFYGGPCPKPRDIQISQFAVFLMIGVLIYNILLVASPLDDKVCMVFGFAMAVICANTPVIETIVGMIRGLVGPGAGLSVATVLILAGVIFFGAWLTSPESWFGRSIERAKEMREIRRAREAGVKEATEAIKGKAKLEAVARA